jgi:hypothetical protein
VTAPCDPVSQTGCASGQSCYWNGTAAVCSAPGPALRGHSCSSAISCAAGLGCAVVGYNGVCRRYCRTDNECGSLGKCVFSLSGTSAKFCSNSCEPTATSTGCFSGNGCYVLQTGAGETTDCFEWGTGTGGSSCASSYDCFTRYTCLSGQCRKICDVASSCTTGACTSVTGWSSYGVCPP